MNNSPQIRDAMGPQPHIEVVVVDIHKEINEGAAQQQITILLIDEGSLDIIIIQEQRHPKDHQDYKTQSPWHEIASMPLGNENWGV